MTESAIVVDHLSKRYGDRVVLDGVSLAVAAGEVVALIGPNGAGKTTTVDVVEGYRAADGGSVRVLGADPWRAGREHRARVGLMLQDGGLDLRARPAETLRQFAGFFADPDDPAALLDAFGLADVAATPYRRLSGGERQRLGFALAVIGRPDVLVLDEPTAGMDPEARSLVRDRIRAERGRGVAVLVTSHDLVDMERVADRVVLLAGGRTVASGAPAALAAGARPRLRFRLDRALADDALAELAASLGASVVRDGAREAFAVVDAAPTPELVAGLARWCAARGILLVETRTGAGSLEDAYLALVAGADGS